MNYQSNNKKHGSADKTYDQKLFEITTIFHTSKLRQLSYELRDFCHATYLGRKCLIHGVLIKT